MTTDNTMGSFRSSAEMLGIPLDATGRPDLQELVERAGRRYAVSIGEEYIEDPFRRVQEAPHQGGYQHITAAEWAAWDQINAEWQVLCRA